MRDQTVHSLTHGVKSKANFFEVSKNYSNAVFLDKYEADPSLNYFIECNKEHVLSLPTLSRIQNKLLSLFSYSLNSGVCKAIKAFLRNNKTVLERLILDNNGLKENMLGLIM